MPETDAISAGLGWVCALDKEFTGVEALRAVKEDGPARRLVAFVMDEKAVPRHGMADRRRGARSLGDALADARRGIGMGYVLAALVEPDTALTSTCGAGRGRRTRLEEADLQREA